jgi:hypothetical protein
MTVEAPTLSFYPQLSMAQYYLSRDNHFQKKKVVH